MIYKMRDGRHLDLSKVTAAGPPYSHSTIHFPVYCQLMDQPLYVAIDIEEKLERALGYSLGWYKVFEIAKRLETVYFQEFLGVWESFKKESK